MTTETVYRAVRDELSWVVGSKNEWEYEEREEIGYFYDYATAKAVVETIEEIEKIDFPGHFFKINEEDSVRFRIETIGQEVFSSLEDYFTHR